MPSPKPKTLQTPFANTTTYGTAGVSGTPEAKALLDVPIDVDPGVGRRTDLAEQELDNRWNSAFASGIPQQVRMNMQENQRRQIRSQGAAEAQQANYGKNMMELERRKILLPQVVQTGSSGYGSQVIQPQGGGLLQGLAQGAMSALPFI